MIVINEFFGLTVSPKILETNHILSKGTVELYAIVLHRSFFETGMFFGMQ
ncbi:MAG: hypothetical protein Ct9H90mP25_4940 [Gammaproteobacteria bacterium]|nr:MAG: hypothetical protein Ct9H90mP25_4940 [Gammaproteobacteria bacterium]